MHDGWARLGAVLASRRGEVGAMGAGPGGGARDGPEDSPVLGMPRACSVRQWLGGAGAHLLSPAVSVGGSQVEELGRHCWSEAATTPDRSHCKCSNLSAQRRLTPCGSASTKAALVHAWWSHAHTWHTLLARLQRPQQPWLGQAALEEASVPRYSVKPVWRHRIIFG